LKAAKRAGQGDHKVITRRNAFLLAAVLLAAGIGGSLTLRAENPTGAPPSAPAPAPQAGHLFGIVTDKNDKGLTVKSDDPTAVTHFPRPEQNQAVGKVWPTIFPDHLVEVAYNMVDGKPVLTGLKLASPTKGSGTETGILMDRKAEGPKIYVDVKVGKNPTMRFVPNWDNSIKAYRKDTVGAMAAANIGDKVEIGWIADPERVHLTGIRVVAKAPAANTPASKPAGS
jgi:hypothetical protein